MKQFRPVYLAVVFSLVTFALQPQSFNPANNGQANQNWLTKGHYRLTELPAIINEQLNRLIFKRGRQPVQDRILVNYQPLEVTVNVGSGTHEKFNYTYDPSGYLTGELYQSWQNNVWTNHTRYTYTNNPYGYHLTSLQELYKPATSTWEYHYLDSYSFNNQNQSVEAISQEWINNAWQNTNKINWTWYADYRPTEMLFYNWLNNAWQNSMRFSYSYNTAGNPTSMQMDNWYNNTWNPGYRSLYQYDANNNPTWFQTEHFESPNWVPDYRTWYTTSPDGYILTEQQEDYDNGAWYKEAYYTYTYNPSWYQTAMTMQLWNNNTWENSSKVSWNRTQWGSYSQELLQGWDMNNWYNQSKSDFTFDPYGNSTSGYNFNWQNNLWTPSDGYLQMFFNGMGGEMGYYGQFYNSTYGSFTDVKEPGELPVEYALYPNYPNPFSAGAYGNPVTVLRFALPVASDVVMTVYDLLGKKVKIILNQEMPAGEHEVVFDAGNLPSGTYFIRMEAGKFSHSQKLLLLK